VLNTRQPLTLFEQQSQCGDRLATRLGTDTSLELASDLVEKRTVHDSAPTASGVFLEDVTANLEVRGTPTRL
jgi:hypothetical protein